MGRKEADDLRSKMMIENGNYIFNSNIRANRPSRSRRGCKKRNPASKPLSHPVGSMVIVALKRLKAHAIRMNGG